MENTKYGKRRKGRWTLIRAKAQDARVNPNSWELTYSEEEMGHWTPPGIEPTDYDDDDDVLIEIILCINTSWDDENV